MKSLSSILLALALSASAATAAEGLSTTSRRTPNSTADNALLTLDRIFCSGEFEERGLGQYQWSKRSESYFTLEAPLWRRNTRGDYWVMDLARAGSLRKLGGNAAPSTLM